MSVTPFAKSFLTLLLILLAAWGVYAALLTTSQSRIIFAGKGMPAAGDLRERFPEARYIPLPASYGKSIACYLPAPPPFANGPVAIVAHGNAEVIGQWGEMAGDLQQAGLSLLLVEYPGYGGSDGEPTQTSIRETFDSACEWLDRNIGGERPVIGLGRSLGTGVICELAGRRHLDGLILLSPFSSLAGMARGMGLPGFLLRTRYDNSRDLRRFDGPVFLCHGDRDRIIPPSHSRHLRQCRDGIELLTADAGHNDLWRARSDILAALSRWLQRHDLLAAGTATP